MKKNRMMRLASVLLVLCLLTTSVISGTFAKYTTQDSANDTARVAKWGVELQVVGNLFGDAYTNAGAITAGDTFTVKSNTTTSINGVTVLEDVVAPGTKNETGFTFSLNGQPEVDGKIDSEVKYQNIFLKKGIYGVMVKVSDNVVTSENFQEFSNLYTLNDTTFTAANKDSTNFYTLEDDINLTHDYYPVEFAMNGTDTAYNVDYTAAGLSDNSLKTIAEYITAADHLEAKNDKIAINNGVTTIPCERTFETNENLDSYVKLGDQKITWKWDFCQNGNCDIGNSACDYCKADTILGMLKNTTENTAFVVKANGADYSSFTSKLTEFEDYCLDIEFSIDITVTQVD